MHILPCAQFYHSYKSCEQKHPNQCVRCSTKCAHTCKSQIKVNHILLFYIFSDHISLFRLYRGEGDPSLHTHWEVPNLPFSTIQHSISLHSISFSPLSRFHLLGHFHHHCANRNLGECWPQSNALVRSSSPISPLASQPPPNIHLLGYWVRWIQPDDLSDNIRVWYLYLDFYVDHIFRYPNAREI